MARMARTNHALWEKLQAAPGVQDHSPEIIRGDFGELTAQSRQKKTSKIHDVGVQIMTVSDQGTVFPEIWPMKKK
eukprot:3341630-Ditylum_brightwellii.AAC.1